ncbi:MAG: aldo/keto reductase [Planctomycetota bacterium]|nr:aldo/keto reductase [Planctomycetota bacterium]
MHEPTRREFLIAASSVAAGSAWARGAGQNDDADQGAAAERKPLPATALGSTGRRVPRLGLGTAPLGRLDSDGEAVRILRRAFDLGVRYIDTAPTYSRGRAEDRIGRALEGYDRREFFIATKTIYRKGDEARRDLEGSLKRLRVEHVDSIQAHALRHDVDELFGPDAVLAAMEKAREEGLIRHIGVTGHANPRYLIDAIRRYPFATALVPVNPLDVSYLSFTREFLPVAAERKVAVIAMKVLADGVLLRDDLFIAAECLHYALSQPAVAVVVPGCDAMAHVNTDHEAAIGFKPVPREKQAEMERRAREALAEKGEWYKEKKRED